MIIQIEKVAGQYSEPYVFQFRIYKNGELWDIQEWSISEKGQRGIKISAQISGYHGRIPWAKIKAGQIFKDTFQEAQ